MKLTSLHSVNVVAVAAALSSLLGCDSRENDPPPVASAHVRFENQSSRTTYNVVWDGSDIGAIRPSQSIEFDTGSGAHTLLFRFSNNGQPACSEARPNLAAGSSRVFSCSIDL